MIGASSHMQTLESRRFLSAVLADHTLIVRGTLNDDSVNITLNDTGDKVQVKVNDADAQLFDKSAVSRIIIRTYTGNDTITVEGAVGKPEWIYSGLGNDTITTGGERDYIFADGGDDVINAGNGVNLIDAGAGNDNITGGDGADIVFAGAGNDTITGGDGKDVLCGEAGADNINGGAGADRIYGGKGNDTMVGGAGNDTMWGQAGDDNLDGGEGDDILGGIVGTNTLIGGAGSDKFFVKSTLEGQTNDFDPVTDILKVTQSE
jgi:Ca2+-binding RTX toxin-like protein